MKGIGYAVVLVNMLMLSYYNTLQAYALYYLGHSFQSPVPWSNCNKSWNTKNCHTRDSQIQNRSNSSQNKTDDVNLPATEFFSRKLLGAHLSNGFDDMAGIKWDMLLCVFIIFILTTSCLVGGIKTSGKAVYVTGMNFFIKLTKN